MLKLGGRDTRSKLAQTQCQLRQPGHHWRCRSPNAPAGGVLTRVDARLTTRLCLDRQAKVTRHGYRNTHGRTGRPSACKLTLQGFGLWARGFDFLAANPHGAQT